MDAIENKERSPELLTYEPAGICDAKSRLAAVQRRVKDRALIATRSADGYVHAHAWTMIAVAAASGLVAGLAVGRARRP